jgi:hypothetical protein
MPKFCSHVTHSVDKNIDRSNGWVGRNTDVQRRLQATSKMSLVTKILDITSVDKASVPTCVHEHDVKPASYAGWDTILQYVHEDNKY